MISLVFYLRAWNFPMERFCGLSDKCRQSIVLRGKLLHNLLNVKVYAIHKLAFSQINFFCNPSCPFGSIHDIRQGHITCERFVLLSGCNLFIYAADRGLKKQSLAYLQKSLPFKTSLAPLECA